VPVEERLDPVEDDERRMRLVARLLCGPDDSLLEHLHVLSNSQAGRRDSQAERAILGSIDRKESSDGQVTRGLPRFLVVAAVVVGAALGSYGIAAAAGGSGSTPTSISGSTATVAAGSPWGNQRSDESLLTGDTEAKVKQLAVAKVGSGATVVRVETDADGHAVYEAHMVKADGTPVTVYVDKQFDVVSVETR
jgi:hypothetical protein